MNDYTYPDARLSMWQSAATEVHVNTLNLSANTASQSPLMSPVHMVANVVKDADKPLERIIDDIKAGLLDIEAIFRPAEDCAKAAAHFLWAELSGNEADSAIYSGELKKSVCDGLGWAECLTAYLGYKALLQSPVYRPNQDIVVGLQSNVKLAIIGDWGTGDDVAKNVLTQVAALKPDVLLHLGDVYYAGTQNENRDNFLEICRSILGDIPLYSLCGNHDMYSGGKGYYWLLDQIGQKASYFCLQNDDWLFLAMDTGFHDNNPFNVSTNITQLVDQDGWSEAEWHLNKIKQAGNRKIVFLSHHQLFSPFGSIGYLDGVKFAYNQNLLGVFGDVLPKVELWFWGHDHRLAIHPPYMNLKRGRLVGASAVPVFSDQQSYSVDEDLRTVEGLPMPAWDTGIQIGNSDNMYNNCFAMMTLNGASATVEYYEVPLLQEAKKFDFTDRV